MPTVGHNANARTFSCSSALDFQPSSGCFLASRRRRRRQMLFIAENLQLRPVPARAQSLRCAVNLPRRGLCVPHGNKEQPRAHRRVRAQPERHLRRPAAHYVSWPKPTEKGSPGAVRAGQSPRAEGCRQGTADGAKSRRGARRDVPADELGTPPGRAPARRRGPCESRVETAPTRRWPRKDDVRRRVCR